MHVTFYRCAPITEVTEQLKNLRMFHVLLSQGTCNHFINFGSHYQELCAQYYIPALFHTLRRFTQDAQHNC
jgi:hypothetical protein